MDIVNVLILAAVFGVSGVLTFLKTMKKAKKAGILDGPSKIMEEK